LNCLLICAEAAPAAAPGADLMNMLLMFAVIGLAFYFIILKPQKREQAERRKMLDALAKGDRVVTTAGIHGKVVDFHKGGEVVTVECAPKVFIDFSRSAIGVVIKKSKEAGEDDDASKGEDSGGKPKADVKKESRG